MNDVQNIHSYLTNLEEFANLTGYELLRTILDGRVRGPNIGETLGFSLQEVSKGRVVFQGSPMAHVTNPLGTVHGGWYGTILDSAMACAVQSCLGANIFYTTLEYKVSIVRAIPVGKKVQAIGTVEHVGRKTGVSRGEIRGLEDDRLYATGSTTCIIIPNDQ